MPSDQTSEPTDGGTKAVEVATTAQAMGAESAPVVENETRGSKETNATEGGVVTEDPYNLSSFSAFSLTQEGEEVEYEDEHDKNENQNSGDCQHSLTTKRNAFRRKKSSSLSSFWAASSTKLSLFITPVVNSLKDEEFHESQSSGSISMSSERDDLDGYPWLDDTIIHYRCRTHTGAPTWRMKCGIIVNHPATQHGILLLITLNAILMGIMTADFVTGNPKIMRAMVIADSVFLVLFAMEVILQLIWHGQATLKDPWLMFDVGVLCCSWIPAFRIFRFARVINRLQILQNLTRAIALVMPRMFSIAMFLLIVIYTYAVLFTELFRHVPFEETQYFESLWASMFTCFEMTTMEWAHIAWELQDQNGAWIPICSFVIICGVIFFNLVLAVICDAVAVLGVDWSGRNKRELAVLTELQKQIVDVQQRVTRLKDLLEQLIKNQKNTLHLLEVQLAKQLNNVETLSNLHNPEVDTHRKSKSILQKKDLLSKVTHDYKFREHKTITKIRILSGLILESDFFEFFIFIIICTDCILMGVATFDAVNENEYTMRILDTISFIFLIIYTTEAAMAFIYVGCGVFSDAWMTFDVFIVVTSWIADLLQGLKTFREFRAVRIVRAFRLIAVLHPLRDLVVAIGTAIPRVSRVMPLVLLIFYVFAVLFVELFRNVQFDDGFDYFGRLDYALFTCLQMMTMEWAELAREAMGKTGQAWTGVLFILFVMISGMLFFDLIKATVCDAVALINGRSRRLAETKKCRKRLKRLGQTVDNLSHQIVHTVNFQRHINNMMLADLRTLSALHKKRKRRQKKER